MISWNRRLGGIGESAIETRLKYFSQPLKTLPEHDEGIDFYCILGGAGSLPSRLFLIQAKATEHFDSRWGRSFDKETIEFWLSQLCPVYMLSMTKSARTAIGSLLKRNGMPWQKC